MDVGREVAKLGSDEATELFSGLKCPVCWDFFVKPHTLPCGHTFCMRCLRNLARIVRTSKPRIPLDRLRFRCPSCRKTHLARPFVRNKAAINYVMREVMTLWFNSPYSSGSVEYVMVRSVASQAETSEPTDIQEIKLKMSSVEETAEYSISETEFTHVLSHRLNYKTPEQSNKTAAVSHEPAPNTTEEVERTSDDNTVTSSSEDESEQDMEIAPLFGNLRVINDDNRNDWPRFRLNRFAITSVSGVLAILFTELAVIFRGIWQSRSRLILTIFWFIYGGLIVCVSRSFLPWLIFYTFIYFVIIYAEMSSPPR